MLKKIAVFVDVQNIYYTTRQAFGRQFDYRKFWQTHLVNHEVIAATAYAIDSNDEGQRRFQSALRAIGFEVRLKPYIQRSDGSAKGDWDVGITLDVIDKARYVDRVILLSGDGDFDLLLDKVQIDFGVETQVFGVRALTSNSLIDAAMSYIEIDQALLI